MPAYLVRLIDTRDIVGVFVADEMRDLLITVEECTNPDACEYVELPTGGIMWTSPAIAVPLSPGSDDPPADAEQLPWASAELSEAWWSVVYGYSDDNWTPFFPDKPRQPRPDPPPAPLGPGQVVPMRKRRS
jgi:hypothetical protein